MPEAAQEPPHSPAGLRFGRGVLFVERGVVAHAAVLVFAMSWAFGGNSLSWRFPLLLLGSLSPALTLLGLFNRASTVSLPRLLSFLLPLLALDCIVLVSLLNPSYRELSYFGELVFIRQTVSSWLPSCAVPSETAQALWLMNCLFLTGFNLMIFARRRDILRQLLWFLAANSGCLAVLGAMQKLAGSTGQYFGSFQPGNRTFFSTFVYHNHWGAFALLSLCVTIALFWHHLRRLGERHRDFLHSPCPLLLLVIVVLSSSMPLSTSRSSTLFAVFVLGLFGLELWRRAKAQDARSARLGVALFCLLGLGAACAIAWLSAPYFKPRLEQTRRDLPSMIEQGSIGGRAILYRDTVRMAADKPLFGWGMGSYRRAFHAYNTQSSPADGLRIFYADAHSDWLQCLAENGIVGSLLIALLVLLPVLHVFRTLLDSRLSAWLLIGCACILLYAWVEFPFGNPAVTLTWWVCLFSALRYPRTQ